MTTTAKSIVLVTVDCLRADHVGFMGYPRPTTPFLDSLAGESFVFPAAIVAGAPTYYSFPAILASRYPLGLGRDVLGLADEEATLATALKAAGYATASFGADNPYISSRFGYAAGFDTFRDLELDKVEPQAAGENPVSTAGAVTRLNQTLRKLTSSWRPARAAYDELYFRYCQRRAPAPESLEKLRPYPSADLIVDQACEWLSSTGDRSFFLWLHLMDPHWPYYPPPQAMELTGQKAVSAGEARYLNSWWNRSDLGPSRLMRRRDEILALYDAGIRWADLQMSRLTESLRASGKWNDCIFALTADHGEEFLDHGGRFHAPGVSEELIHVPLLIRVPGCEKKSLGKSPFSLLHLSPTLLGVADVPVPAAFQGKNFWDQIRTGESLDAVAISECVTGCTNPLPIENRLGSRALSVRAERFKLILHFDPPSETLFDLEADPGEQAPLAPSAHKAVRRELLEAAREHLRLPSSETNARTRVRARLRDRRLEWSRSFPQRSESAAS